MIITWNDKGHENKTLGTEFKRVWTSPTNKSSLKNKNKYL